MHAWPVFNSKVSPLEAPAIGATDLILAGESAQRTIPRSSQTWRVILSD
jgi:hypothetical protein